MKIMQKKNWDIDVYELLSLDCITYLLIFFFNKKLSGNEVVKFITKMDFQKTILLYFEKETKKNNLIILPYE